MVRRIIIVVYLFGWASAADAMHRSIRPDESEFIRVPVAVIIATMWPVIYVASRVHEQLTPAGK